MQRNLMQLTLSPMWMACRRRSTRCTSYSPLRGEELRPLFGRTLLPSILDKAFKRELRWIEIVHESDHEFANGCRLFEYSCPFVDGCPT